MIVETVAWEADTCATVGPESVPSACSRILCRSRLLMCWEQVTWMATKEQMQTPRKECSVIQERLAGLVTAVLREVFADTLVVLLYVIPLY